MAGIDTLLDIVSRKHWIADSGGPGLGKNMHGAAAADVVIRVPPGTIVSDRDRGNVLKDLVDPGDEVVVARNGRGGRGNKSFATSTHQLPYEFQEGKPGEERWIVLELKVLADVGLVGLPNAGKSTLLSRLSAAQPKIADYPFTTKSPVLGIVDGGEYRSFVMVDIPGLIEGAHAGVGLGHEFLRHVERTRVIVHLVDGKPIDGSDPVANYHAIRRELELYGAEYGHDLAARPEVVCVTKLDVTGADEAVDRLREELDRPVWSISAVAGQGLKDLVGAIMAELGRLDEAEAEPPRKRRIPPHRMSMEEPD